MVEYTLEIDEGSEDVIKRLKDKLPELEKLILQRFSKRIESRVSVDLKRGRWGILSGGNGRTGRLANSVWSDTAGSEYAEVGAGSNVNYAAVHEFGFAGVVQVRAHTRSKVFGRDAKNGPFTVPAHSRRVNIPGKHYTRKSIEDFFRSGLSDRIASGAFEAWKRRYL